MLISISEILGLLLTCLVLGFIFIDAIPRGKNKKSYLKGLIYAGLIVSPGIILHELMHKFTALFFGLEAVFKVFPLGIIIAVVLKLVHSPFLLIAPGYVEIGNTTNLQMFFISFMGPFTNLVLWLIAKFRLKSKNLSKNQLIFWHVTRQINITLFIFNMIPVPPLDGSKVFYSLYKLIFS
ncbi:M50 family metallopeptidase [Candidatus Woesearchaeota archaeon]|nr:hypothetical protein [uncultured archaeon]MBS3150124.1 M50 family metallopeptidase [Candidatus Woesearchaeota archaeon]